MQRLLDLFELALRGIWRQKLRALMAMATIAVAIFSISLIVGNALERRDAMTELMNMQFDPTLLQVSAPSSDEPGERPLRAHLEMRDVAALKGIPGISWIEPITSLPVTLKSGRAILEGDAIATTPALLQALQFKITSGRALGPAEDECMLTEWSAKAVFKVVVGQAVRVNGRLMKVVGIVDPNRAKLKFDCLMSLAAGHNIAHISYPGKIYIRAADAAVMPQVRRAATNYISAEFGKHFSKKMVRADTDFNEGAIQSFNRSLLSQGVFVILGLMLAMATVAEMLYADVQTNLAEIGILRALGARKLDILGQIALQSVMISLAGGCIGLMLTQSYYFWPEEVRQLWRWKESASITYFGLVLSFTAGVVASLMPAYTAVQISPTEAMRETSH